MHDTKEIDIDGFKLDLTGKTCYVYFIRIGETGPIKIGCTKKIARRILDIQVNNPYLIYLLAVSNGYYKEEKELHKKFKKYNLYGEWFEPNDEIIEYINQFKILNIVAEDFRNRSGKRGKDCHNWKGENASLSSKRQRARAFTRYKDQCDKCKQRKGVDTVFIDGDPDNLNSDNIALYCRRCKMEADGRLENMKILPKRKSSFKPCIICRDINKYLTHGRCHACEEFFIRNGFERSEYLSKLNEPKPIQNCIICNTEVKQLAKGKCHSCYEYYRRNGTERNFKLEIDSFKDSETEDLKLLRTMNEMTFEKASLIRKMFISNNYTSDFIINNSKISAYYFNIVIRNECFYDENYSFKPKKINKIIRNGKRSNKDKNEQR